MSLKQVLRLRSAGLVALVSVAGVAVCIPWYSNSFAGTAIDIERANAEVNTNQPIGRTALMVAARKGDLQQVRALLGAGASVNRANKNGGTPLMYAASGGKLAVVELLLEQGAEVNAVASNGWSALMVASTKGFLDIAAALLRSGADANLADVYGWTPLMRAAYEDRPAIVRLLSSRPGTRIDQTGENGFTALHLAVSRGHRGIVELLVKAGASTDAADATGRTPLRMAVDAKRADLVQIMQRDASKSRFGATGG